MIKQEIGKPQYNLAGLLVFLSFLLLLSASGLSLSLYNPVLESNNTLDSEVRFKIQNSSSINNSKLRISPPRSDWRIFNLTYNNSSKKIQTTLPSSMNRKKGIYNYRVYSDNESFPNNRTLSFSIASTNSTLESLAYNFTDNFSESEDCNYRLNDFSCSIETFQAEMIQSNALNQVVNPAVEC